MIAEEPIESSQSNIEMSKSEKSLQKPLQMAIDGLNTDDIALLQGNTANKVSSEQDAKVIKSKQSYGNFSKEAPTAAETKNQVQQEEADDES